MNGKIWEGKVKQIHFRIEWELFRRFRSLFPDKGDMQRVFRQMLIELLDKHDSADKQKDLDEREDQTT
jgi:hypothetical protein